MSFREPLANLNSQSVRATGSHWSRSPLLDLDELFSIGVLGVRAKDRFSPVFLQLRDGCGLNPLRWRGLVEVDNDRQS